MRPTAPPDVVLTGRFAPADERRFAHVPFAVPPGLRQLHLRCDYTDRIDPNPLLDGGNTLDLGLFDERGTEAGGPGFRGWSGSARTQITVGETWATPPYRAGPLGAGTWHLLLGPYKVGPRGLDYRVEVSFDPDLPPDEPPPIPPPTPVAVPPAAEPGWVRGELHCHTLRSDGDAAPGDVLRAAAAIGLDFVAFTDHNAPPAPVPGAPAGATPLVIPGIEVTTYGGHWNVWGTEGWYEFRDPSPAAVAEAMRAAVAAGGLVAMNHPKPFGPPWTYGDDLGYAAIEVWNGPWERLNAVALARWEAHLRRGARIVAVGGSDAHRLRAPRPGPLGDPRLGHPTTWVRPAGPPTPATVLDAIRHGRCFLSATPAGPQLYLTPTDGGARVRAVGAKGATLTLLSDAGAAAAFALTADDWATAVPFPPTAAYLRAQILDANGGMLALSNPIWR